jgi:hypothetical protein
VQQHVEPKDHGYKCVGYKKKVCLKKMQQFSYEKDGVGCILIAGTLIELMS